MVTGRLLKGVINVGDNVELVGLNCNITTVITGEKESTQSMNFIMIRL